MRRRTRAGQFTQDIIEKRYTLLQSVHTCACIETPFKCVHDNWHMNHALECNHVRCAGTSTNVCHVCVTSSNCAMARLLLLLQLIMHTMQNNYC